MSDPKIRSALECPDVQGIISRALGSPDLILQYRELPNFKILLEAGILKINRGS